MFENSAAGVFAGVLTLGVLGVACAAPGSGQQAPATAKVFKYRGSVQCTGGGAAIAEMRQQLEGAGIPVSASSCGSDGNFRATVCGSPDGAIAIFTIPERELERAASLSFVAVSTLPTAQETPCR
ncbi:MAG TPA: hypothetical protein VKF40_12270 [Burkholderiales bacterium]|nr:hypothetical protein [Burkholderiales bacterium]